MKCHSREPFVEDKNHQTENEAGLEALDSKDKDAYANVVVAELNH
jgi:hypothetical protein